MLSMIRLSVLPEKLKSIKNIKYIFKKIIWHINKREKWQTLKMHAFCTHCTLGVIWIVVSRRDKIMNEDFSLRNVSGFKFCPNPP